MRQNGHASARAMRRPPRSVEHVISNLLGLTPQARPDPTLFSMFFACACTAQVNVPLCSMGCPRSRVLPPALHSGCAEGRYGAGGPARFKGRRAQPRNAAMLQRSTFCELLKVCVADRGARLSGRRSATEARGAAQLTPHAPDGCSCEATGRRGGEWDAAGCPAVRAELEWLRRGRVSGRRGSVLTRARADLAEADHAVQDQIRRGRDKSTRAREGPCRGVKNCPRPAHAGSTAH